MYLCLIFSKVDSQDALVLLDYLDYCDYLDYQKSIYESIATVMISCQKVAENTQILKIAKFAM